MPRRPDPNCEELCQEHSGIKTMVTVVLAGVICTILLQAYNTFIATARIESAIVGIQSDMNGLRQSDATLDKRVSKLEDVIFKK